MLTLVMAAFKSWVCIVLLGCNGTRGWMWFHLATSMPRKGEDLSGHVSVGLYGALLGWQTARPQRSENVQRGIRYLLWRCFLILMASTVTFAQGTHTLDWAWKEHTERTTLAQETLISQIVCAQREAFLVQDYKYSKKHFADFHLGILIMNKCP